MRGELTILNFNLRMIVDDGAEIVPAFLMHDKTVKSVLLYGYNVGPQGVKAIAESLKYNQTVEHLGLDYNQIGDEGAEALIEALNYNVCKEALITYSVAPEIRAIIKHLTKIRNKILIPAAVRRASLCLIAARRNFTDAGNFALFPKEIVRMIAMEVYATRKEPIWISALGDFERTGESGD